MTLRHHMCTTTTFLYTLYISVETTRLAINKVHDILTVFSDYQMVAEREKQSLGQTEFRERLGI